MRQRSAPAGKDQMLAMQRLGQMKMSLRAPAQPGGPIEARELNERKREVRRQPQHQARRLRVRQVGRRPRRGGQRGPAGNG